MPTTAELRVIIFLWVTTKPQYEVNRANGEYVTVLMEKERGEKKKYRAKIAKIAKLHAAKQPEFEKQIEQRTAAAVQAMAAAKKACKKSSKSTSAAKMISLLQTNVR